MPQETRVQGNICDLIGGETSGVGPFDGSNWAKRGKKYYFLFGI